MATDKKNADKITGTIHLRSGEVLSEGQEDELKDAIGASEEFQTDGEADAEKVDAELQRLADEGAIQGFGTAVDEPEGEGEGEGEGGTPKPAKKAAKRGRGRPPKK